MIKAAVKPEREESSAVLVRVSAAEKKQLQRLADKWTGGNVSLLMRYAALNFKPKKHEIAKKAG